MGVPASNGVPATTGVNFDAYLSVNATGITYVEPTTPYPVRNVRTNRQPVKVDISNSTGNGFAQSARGQKSMTFSMEMVNLVRSPIVIVEGSYLNVSVPIAGYGEFSGVCFVDSIGESGDVTSGFPVTVTLSSHGPYTFSGATAITDTP